MIVLVVAATIPATIVLLTFQDDLRAEREIAARKSALHQAELVNLAIGSIIDGAAQIMFAMGSLDTVRDSAPGCGKSLAELRSRLQPYAFLTVLHPDGSSDCAGSNLGDRPGLRELARQAAAQRAIVIGHYSPPSAEIPQAYICVAQSMPGEVGRVTVAAISLDWLGAHLAELPQDEGGSIAVADAEGTLLAILSAAPGRAGAKLQPDLLPFVRASTPGTAIVGTPGGHSKIVGYVPAPVPPKGMFVAYSFDDSDLIAGTDRIAMRGYLMVGIGAVISLLFALLAGNRLVRMPTLVLLRAARRWGEGDLAGRAAIPFAAAAEFHRLGAGFNRMVETLEVQRAELHALNEALELRVADRTRALLESNNRLQVEIAERELTESSLRQAQKLQAVGQLAGGIAHDFNNLLTAILGSLELLRRRLPDGDPRQIRLLDTATEAVARGSRLTAQLLAFSTKQPLLALPTNVTAAVEGMAGLLSSTLGPAVRVELRLAPDLWPALLDRNQFEGAILNLALNARDAMPEGGRLIIAANNATVSARDAGHDLVAGDYLRVIVADFGRGIAPEVLPRVFDPFFTTKAANGASGLGLSQVHGMVHQSGGDVSIDSTPGDGTRVIMMLPRSMKPAPAALPDDAFRTSPALNRNQAILLVDDDAAVREVTAAMLIDNGYHVVTAADGRQGLEALREQGDRIQLVIADYAMPGMSGRELLALIRQERPDLPFLLATGYADYDAMTADGPPVDQIIGKPFRSVELLDRIHMVRDRAARMPVGD